MRMPAYEIALPDINRLTQPVHNAIMDYRGAMDKQTARNDLQAERDRQNAFRESQAARSQSNADRSYDLQQRQFNANQDYRQKQIGIQQSKYSDEQRQQRLSQAGRIANYIKGVQDPGQRQQLWGQFLSSDQDLAKNIGNLPMDQGLEWVIAKSGGGAGGTDAKYGLNPIYGRDASGNVVAMQPSNRGGLIVANPPNGVTVDPGLAPEARARGTAIGKGQGEAQVDLPKVEHQTRVLSNQIDALLDDDYLSSMTGASNYWPTITPRGNETQARIDQINSKAFLQAFQELKGAGAITEAEGAKAQQALTRLSNQYQSDDAYRAALEEFKYEVGQLAQLARKRAGVPEQSSRDSQFRIIGVE